MAIITYPLDGIEYNAEEAQTYLCTRTSGVFAAENNYNFEIIESGKKIKILPGLAWINNTPEGAPPRVGKSVYNETPVELPILLSDPDFPRIDRIVLRFSKIENGTVLAIKQGVAASEPVPPDVDKSEDLYELGLFTIDVPKASTIVRSQDIKDTRLDEKVCGLMRDGVTKIPTNKLYEDANALMGQLRHDADMLIAELKTAVDKVAAGNDVMLQTAFNPSGKTGQVAFEADNNSYTLFLAWTDESVGIKQVVGVRQAHGEFDYNEMLKSIFEKGKVPTIIARKIKDIDGNGKIDSSDTYTAMRWCSNLEPEKELTTEQIFKEPDSFNTAILTFVTWGSGSGNMKFEGYTNLTGKMTVFLREDGKHTISIDGK